MFEIIQEGFGVSIQDYPGRLGYWNVGIPPSGPMDSLAFRIANRIAENAEDAAGLEITGFGPTLHFHDEATIAFAGAHFSATLDGEEIPWWEPVRIPSGSRVKIGKVSGGGFRCYMAVHGGIDVPLFLGSRSTFAFGGFGGFQGRTLKAGDCVDVFEGKPYEGPRNSFSLRAMPKYGKYWVIGVLPGPHGTPDFIAREFEETFFSSEYKVDYNANRLGIRLQGPKPVFAREDGGEGGRHPSNMHDYPYAIGTLNLSGDTPIIIGVDGPSLGGFISYVTIPTAELWKTGQLKPGDTVRFRKMTLGEANQLREELETIIGLL